MINRLWLFVASLFVLLLAAVIVYLFGFGEMASKYGALPERLRDYTFPVWLENGISQHGFLVFLTKESFGAKEAYSNHSPIYLFFLYMLFKIELIFPFMSMRITSAYLSMAASLGAVMAIFYSKNKLLDYRGVILVLLGLVYFLTMPTYWISAGKFNVDNPFNFYFPLLILVAYNISYNNSKDICFWIPICLLCLFAPKACILIGLFLIVWSVNFSSARPGFAWLGFALTGCGIFLSLVPVAISKLLGFNSKNSSWLFRSGLDGDTTYFSNFFNAVFFPADPRPSYLLLAPMFVLGVQFILQYRGKINVDKFVISGSDNLFISILFSPYLLTLVFWPQAVAIHPYLYDFILLGPMAVWIIFNFSGDRGNALCSKYFVFSFWLMVVMIMFNLTQLAQASRCLSCAYPSWSG